MANRIPQALSWDDYKNREPIKRDASAQYLAPLNDENRHLANPDNDRGPVDDNDYAGGQDFGPLPERISIIALVKSSPLYVPEIGRAVDDGAAMQHAFQHYTGILQAGGPRALKLIRAAASEGNDAVLKSREMGHGDTFTAVSGHRGFSAAAAALVTTALDYFPATREDAQSSVYAENTSDEESVRKTLARAKTKDLERKGFQKLPNDPTKVPFADILGQFQRMCPTPDTSRIHPTSVTELLKDNLVYDEREDSLTYKKVIGLKEDLKARMSPEHAETIVAHYNSPHRYGALKVPPSAIAGGEKLKRIDKSRALFCDASQTDKAKAILEKASATDEFVLGSRADELKKTRTKARISTVHYAKSSTMALEKMGFDGASARYLKNGMQMIDHADAVDMVLSKEYNKLNGFLLGYAASVGKLGTITMGDKELSLSEAQAVGASHYISTAAAIRKSLSQGLDVDMSTPEAAIGLSLFESEKDGAMPAADIRNLQKAVGSSLLDIMEQASDDEGARKLQDEFRISPTAIRLLRDEQASANAGRNLSNVLDTVSRHGHQLLGRADLPAALRDGEQAPLFAIASGNVDLLHDGKQRLGIVGDTLRNADADEAELAARVAPHLAEIDKTDIGRVWVHRATPMPIEPKKNDIVVVHGGLGVFGNDDDRDAQDARDMAGALTLSFEIPSREVYRAPVRGSKGKGEVVEVQNLGSDSTMPKAARAMAHLSERLLVTNANDQSARNPARVAVETHLRSGKRVIAIDPGVNERSAFTHALLSTTGRKALVAAGYGASTVEDPVFKALEGGPVSIRAGVDPAKTAKNIETLVTKGTIAGAKRQRVRQKTDQIT